MSVCTFWANKSQTGKQTNKLATEIGNSRMPFSITLASDQRAAADAASDVRQRQRERRCSRDEGNRWEKRRCSRGVNEGNTSWSWLWAMPPLVAECNIHHICVCVCVYVGVCAVSVPCLSVPMSAYLCILVAIFMRSRAMQTFLMSFYNNSSLHYGHSHSNNNQKQYQLHCSIARRTKFSL